MGKGVKWTTRVRRRRVKRKRPREVGKTETESGERGHGAISSGGRTKLIGMTKRGIRNLVWAGENKDSPGVGRFQLGPCERHLEEAEGKKKCEIGPNRVENAQMKTYT